MTIELAAELWSELRRYVNTVDRSEAAESVVSLLIDHDYDADEIREAFKGDSDIKGALAGYLNNNEELDEDIDDDDVDDENYNWDED